MNPLRALDQNVRSGSQGTRVLGLALLVLATACYLATTATSFVPGDPALYLNLANTGGLVGRGNGLPLYITMLNAAVHLPLPVQVSDGIRCGLMTALFGIVTVMLTFRAGLKATGSPASAFAAAVAILVSGLIWQSAAWIMPHITLALVASVIINLLLAVDKSGSPRISLALGLASGLGFGLMPNSLLLLPAAVLHLWLSLQGDARRGGLIRLGAGTVLGLVVNLSLTAVHERISPRVADQDLSITEAVLFYMRGGDETGWLMDSIASGDILRGLLRLPLGIAADFETVGTTLAILGFWVGLRRCPSLHASLFLAFALVSVWVGTYPGDTRVLHGATAYPIAALWLAIGAETVLASIRARALSFELDQLPARLLRIGLGAALCATLLAGIAGGRLLYREALCGRDFWMFEAFCSERVPEPARDRYLVRARDAVMQVPQGALVLGASWDAMHQMNYFIRVHRTREDLDGAFDLTKLSAEEFEMLVRPYWQRGEGVYLFGEWKDVEMWSPTLLAYFDGKPRSEFLFELQPIERAGN